MNSEIQYSQFQSLLLQSLETSVNHGEIRLWPRRRIPIAPPAAAPPHQPQPLHGLLPLPEHLLLRRQARPNRRAHRQNPRLLRVQIDGREIRPWLAAARREEE